MENPDYIIIGGGSAGCVIANRLTENPARRVLLIEAGGEDINPLIHIPAGYIKTMVNPNINWMFESEAEDATDGRRILFPRGKVLGGSSAINAMLYVRGQRQDYDSWAKDGNAGWSYDDVLPYFKRAEQCEAAATENMNPQVRGDKGPLNVAMVRSRYDALDKLMTAAANLGYPHNPDYNSGEQNGFGYYQVTQKNGLRHSTKKAYIDPIKHRKNLKIITRAHVLKINIEGGGATGVTCKTKKGIEIFNAQRGVILSAGAIQSPQILELSGIGNPEHLTKNGIEVKHPLQGVGENMADHYISRIAWKLRHGSINHLARGFGLASEIIKYAALRRGVLSLPAGILAGFVKSSPELETPDIQYHIANASFANPAKRIFDDFPGMTMGACQLRPESRGSVHIKSPNPMEAPTIITNYLATDLDQKIHVRGLEIARDIMQSPIMADYVETEIRPGIATKNHDALLDYAKKTGVTLYHPVSTCRMGTHHDKKNVVDNRLRVHGIKGLRIIDASIMPELVSGNTNAPTIMIGEKGADMIIKDE